MATQMFTTLDVLDLSTVNVPLLVADAWTAGANGAATTEVHITAGAGGGSGGHFRAMIPELFGATSLLVDVPAGGEVADLRIIFGDGNNQSQGIHAVSAEGQQGANLGGIIDDLSWITSLTNGVDGGNPNDLEGGGGGTAPNGGGEGGEGNSTGPGEAGQTPGAGGGGGGGDLNEPVAGGAGARGEVRFDWPDNTPSLTGPLNVGETVTGSPGTWDGHSLDGTQVFEADDAAGTNASVIGDLPYEIEESRVGRYLTAVDIYDGGINVYSSWRGPVGPRRIFTESGTLDVSSIKLPLLVKDAWTAGANGVEGIEDESGGVGGGSGLHFQAVITDLMGGLNDLEIGIPADGSEHLTIRFAGGPHQGEGINAPSAEDQFGIGVEGIIDEFGWITSSTPGNDGGEPDGNFGGTGGDAPNGGLGGTTGGEESAGQAGAAPGGGGQGGGGNGGSFAGGAGARGEVRFDWPDVYPEVTGIVRVGAEVDATQGLWNGHTQDASAFYEFADDEDGTNATGAIDFFPVILLQDQAGKYIRAVVAWDSFTYQVRGPWTLIDVSPIVFTDPVENPKTVSLIRSQATSSNFVYSGGYSGDDPVTATLSGPNASSFSCNFAEEGNFSLTVGDVDLEPGDYSVTLKLENELGENSVDFEVHVDENPIKPTLSGDAVLGETVTASSGSWEGHSLDEGSTLVAVAPAPTLDFGVTLMGNPLELVEEEPEQFAGKFLVARDGYDDNTNHVYGDWIGPVLSVYPPTITEEGTVECTIEANTTHIGALLHYTGGLLDPNLSEVFIESELPWQVREGNFGEALVLCLDESDEPVLIPAGDYSLEVVVGNEGGGSDAKLVIIHSVVTPSTPVLPTDDQLRVLELEDSFTIFPSYQGSLPEDNRAGIQRSLVNRTVETHNMIERLKLDGRRAFPRNRFR